MRRLLILLALNTLLVGCAEPARSQSAAAVAPTPSIIGSTRALRGYQRKPVRLIVQEGAFHMQEKALDENDTKTLAWVWTTYEFLDVADTTSVRILKFDSTGVHVEVTAGPSAGRRGWIARRDLSL